MRVLLGLQVVSIMSHTVVHDNVYIAAFSVNDYIWLLCQEEVMTCPRIT